MSEPVKVLPMAKLLRLAREKEERERTERESAANIQHEASADFQWGLEESIEALSTSQPSVLRSVETIPGETIVIKTIPQETIEGDEAIAILDKLPANIVSTLAEVAASSHERVQALKEESRSNSKTSSQNQTIVKSTIPDETIVISNIVSPSRGYFPIFNDISDHLIPEAELTPFEQSILLRLYRLSRGWKSDECEIGLGTLAKQCVMSRSQVQRSIAALIKKGLLVNLGSSKKGGKEGNRYKVLPGLPVDPSKSRTQETIVKQTIVSQETTIPSENTEVIGGIVPDGNNKDSVTSTKKENNKTHSQQGVGGESRFSLKECRRYADHLHKTGQGINNPGGYATKIHRSGEADDLIEEFLNPPNQIEPKQCPDCHGKGRYYPGDFDKGVKICKHEKLRTNSRY